MLSGRLKLLSRAALAPAGLLTLLALPSRADITITAQEVSGMGQTPPVPQPLRLLYKGANARLEVSGEPTLIQDGKSSVIYGLDTVRKTYYMTVPTEEEPGTSAPAKEDVKLDLRETNQTLTFAGTTAHQYLVTGTVTHPRPEDGFRRGERRRGNGGSDGSEGGIPGRSGGPGGEGRNGRSVPVTPAQWSLSGDIWLSDNYKFPSKENTVFAAQLAAASSGPFQQPLADALDKHKGLPLLARMTVTYVPASSAGRPINQYGGVVEGAKAVTTPTITITTFTVKSISDTPLADTLFQAPLSYTLVAAPLDPYTPGTPVSAAP